MNGLIATFQRELRSYFFSPLAYVILAFFLFSNGRDFSLIVSFLSDPRSGGSTMPLLQLYLGGTILFWVLMLFVPPALTMRLLAEERRSGTIEPLMTAPVTEGQVVVGKYLAALVFFVFLWLPTLIYVGIIGRSGDIDWGPVASGYLGIFLVGALFLAIGILCSSFTKSQIVAAVATIAVLLTLFASAFLEQLVNGELLQNIFGYVNLLGHMDELSKGIVDSRRIVFYLSSVVLLLFLSARVLESRKWR